MKFYNHVNENLRARLVVRAKRRILLAVYAHSQAVVFHARRDARDMHRGRLLADGCGGGGCRRQCHSRATMRCHRPATIARRRR